MSEEAPELVLPPEPESRSCPEGELTSWLMIRVTMPLGFTRAFTCMVTPVLREEMPWVIVPFSEVLGEAIWPVSTGT